MKRIFPVLACLAATMLPRSVAAQSNNSYPMLMSVTPAAAPIGLATEHEVSARYNLYGASQVLVSGQGVTGEILPFDAKEVEKALAAKKTPSFPKARVKFTVAADALPGVRDFRIITPHGASTVGQLVIARDPVVLENAENNLPAQAQMVGTPATVCGTIEKAEDLDYYRFRVEAGTCLSFHVRSQRLLNRLHDMQSRVDPMITLRSTDGATLAACDNYYAGDPLLAYTFEQAGEYLLEVRDVRYQGSPDWTYSIEINNRPFVTQASPMAIRPGVETTLALVGMNLPAEPKATLQVPADTPPGLAWVSPLVGGSFANEFAVFVSGQAPIQETAAENNTVASGQSIPGPCVISGRIESAADQDCYTFAAKKGEALTFEVVARRGWSGLDPFLRILNDKGAAVSEADDLTEHRVTSADSRLENWIAPADGNYSIEIRDLHQRGGPQYTYAIEVTHSTPYFLLEADTDKTLLAPGTNGVIYVRALRRNGFSGEIQLAVDNLPAGVGAVPGRILAGAPDGCIILQAAPDAKAAAANLRITGTALHPMPGGEPLRLSVVAQPLQEYYAPGGGRGNYPVDLHTVSVAEPMDIRGVTVSTTSVALQPGGTQRIEVTIDRAPDYKGNVTLDVVFQHLEQHLGNSLPKGVTLDGANSKTLLTGDETKGFITLKAAADSPPVDRQLVPVMANVSLNFVMKLTFAGPPVYVSVAPATAAK
jgi:hypothetical protein